MVFKKYMTFVVPGEESRDLDIAALYVEPADWLDRYDLRTAAIPIPQTFSLESFLKEFQARSLEVGSIVLRAIGFPRNASESRIDLEEQRVVSQPMEVVFRYSRPSDVTNRHIGAIVFSPLGDLDGMSGSPVFLRTSRPDELPKRYVFVGMLVRASPTVVEFVSGKLIGDALQHAESALRP
jgi:hypothetical protein